MNVDWNPPAPRQGLAGEWDKFVGPGQTKAEFWLILLPSILAALALAVFARMADLGWTILQTVVAVLLAFDLAGGVITNATSAAKRWYHRPGQGVRQHLGFVALHAIHLFLVAWLFRGMDWTYFAVFYLGLLAAALVVLQSPLYLQRPVALLAYCLILLINFYILMPTPGMEWFVPVFFAKLLISHLLKEAPYLPEIAAD